MALRIVDGEKRSGQQVQITEELEKRSRTCKWTVPTSFDSQKRGLVLNVDGLVHRFYYVLFRLCPGARRDSMLISPFLERLPRD